MEIASIELSGAGCRSALLVLLLVWHGAAHAQEADPPQPMPDQFERAATPTSDAPAIALQYNYSSDLNADLSGGTRRGTAFLGKAAIIADADLDRLVGLPDATAHVSVIDIHGTGLSASRVDNLATVSGLEAEPAIRLNQAWIEVGLGNKARLRLGKFTAQDFMASSTAAFFVNSTFGWPTSFATDLPQGGPSWPLAVPGGMVKLRISSHWSVTGAVFAGTPAGSDDGNPQRIDEHGFGAFRFAGKPFVIAEAARKLGDAATVKLGGWVHFARFDLVTPGAPATVARDWSVYALADWRVLGQSSDARKLSLFARASLAPADRNPVSLYLDLGATFTAPFAARPDDTVGIAYAMTRLSPQLDISGAPRAEQVVEVSYSAAFGAHFSLQPNLQLIVDPIDPSSFVGRHRNALVAGMRFNAQF